MDVNREREEKNCFSDDRITLGKIAENAQKAKELSEFCGIVGMLALKDWSEDQDSTKALAVGVELLNHGQELKKLADRLAQIGLKAMENAQKE